MMCETKVAEASHGLHSYGPSTVWYDCYLYACIHCGSSIVPHRAAVALKHRSLGKQASSARIGSENAETVTLRFACFCVSV